jgi:nucleoside 2-deoxyribosyltransferase
MTVYLCGAMEGLTEEQAKVWRETATTLLNQKGINVLDPTRRKKFHDQPFSHNLSRRIVSSDFWDIDKSKVILVNLKERNEGKCWGSISEITYAWMKNKVIILILEDEYYHPFLETFYTEKYGNLEEALSAVEKYYE